MRCLRLCLSPAMYGTHYPPPASLVHLLNRSCDPNCYSRAITLTDPLTGATTDHVIITAKVPYQ